MNLVENPGISFRTMGTCHQEEVMKIFNHYIEKSFAAYPESALPPGYFKNFLEITAGYPAYVIDLGNEIIGFCFLHPYSHFSTFKRCAEITCFIKQEHTGKGIGEAALKKLEDEGKLLGIEILLASISSENRQSINFHLKNGFARCGRFENIGKKLGKNFDVVWMQKRIG